MANSLRDQFLKAGLVDKSKVNKVKTDKRKQKKQKQAKGAVVVDENRLRLEQEQAAKVERDRLLNQQRKQEAEQKAIAAQIKQIIEMNSLSLDEGEIAYNFSDDNKVKTLYVTDDLHARISNGSLAIVHYESGYNVVSKQVAEKIAQRDPEAIVVLNDRLQESLPEADDPYAEFQVPDDLMW
jgi:hypothetical protein